jgi:LysM repeat protein
MSTEAEGSWKWTLPDALVRFACIGAALLAACTSASVSTPTASPPPPDPRTATLSEIVNLVQARTSQAEAFASAPVGLVVRAGGQVQTGQESRSRLDLSDGAIIRLAQNSSFTLQDISITGGNAFARLGMEVGKIWVSLTGGALEVETPVGVAAVRGSFAIFAYAPGDPSNPNDDLLLIDCLEGTCTASNAAITQNFSNLTRFVLTAGGGILSPLSDSDVQAFLADNPESTRLVTTLTAVPPASPSATPTTATQTPTVTPVSAQPVAVTATSTSIATATPNATPTFSIIGQHVVKPGETLLCIARGYGILPDAIAQANGLATPFTLNAGQTLRMPAVQWTNISQGPVCATQFQSPYPGLPPATNTPVPTPTVTATGTCPQGMILDPKTGRCVPLPTPSVTPTGTFSSDTVGPVIAGLSANPTSVAGPNTCTVTFQANVRDVATIVAWASVEWTSYAGASPVNAGSIQMSGPTSGGTWTTGAVQVSVPGSVAAAGSLTWLVKSADGNNNISTSASGPAITNSAAVACP